MSWIRERELGIAAIIQVMSINQEAMDAVGALNDAVTFGNSTLTRVQEEAIATTVSVINKCRY